MVDSVRSSPFIPVAWMRDHSGMQGSAYFEDPKDIEAIETDWLVGMKAAVQHVESMNMRGLTKQLCNRPLEAYMYHTVLVSGTEWENFFALRCPQYFIGNQPDQCYRSWSDLSDVCGLNPFLDLKKEKDGSALPEDIREQDILYRMKHNKGQADIHMMLTAEAIWDAMKRSVPKLLNSGEWHIPFGDDIDVSVLIPLINNGLLYDGHEKSLVESFQMINSAMVKISTARCAQTSYTVIGEDEKAMNFEKLVALHDRLSKSGHWSPFEHCAKVMDQCEYFLPGTNGFSGNFRGFVQYRKLFSNENIVKK